MENEPKVYENHGQDSRIKEVKTAPQLNAKAGTGGGNLPLVQEPVTYDLFNVTAPVNRQNQEPGDPCHTLAKANAEHAALVGQPEAQGVGDKHCPLRTAGGHGAPATINNASVRRLTPTECERLQGFSDNYVRIPVKLYTGKPKSKRFQKFPDLFEPNPDGTWTEYASDNPRYKALGNSWAVPCAAWIGKRIAEVHNKKIL